MTDGRPGLTTRFVYEPLLPFAVGPVAGGLTYEGGAAAGVVATLSTGGVVSVPCASASEALTARTVPASAMAVIDLRIRLSPFDPLIWLLAHQIAFGVISQLDRSVDLSSVAICRLTQRLPRSDALR